MSVWREGSSSSAAPVRAWSALSAEPRVVALGGGTGLPLLLRGLKRVLYPSQAAARLRARDRDRLTGIVTMADDGGSSGRLRKAYGVLPPGDLRNCLLALAGGDRTMASLFDFRFQGNGGLGGHNLGNLILTALSQVESDLMKAVEWASEVLATRGRVLPASLDPITLRAEYVDGSCVEGESRIATAHRCVRRISLHPRKPRALPQAVRAIAEADLIVIGPGSLFTSIMPILLIRELGEAIGRSTARVVLVLNLMTEPGETDGYSAADFVTAILEHAPLVRIHDVLLNSALIPDELIARYASEGSLPVAVDAEPFRFLGCRPVYQDLLEAAPRVRHDPVKLAQAVLDLVMEAQECSRRT